RWPTLKSSWTQPKLSRCPRQTTHTTDRQLYLQGGLQTHLFARFRIYDRVGRAGCVLGQIKEEVLQRSNSGPEDEVLLDRQETCLRNNQDRLKRQDHPAEGPGNG